ncbi:hypothetical protein HK405_007290 [Cladochytrium tenue]|nr:hypothetical protein HK405_007290 [Cladochytrium tenue]
MPAIPKRKSSSSSGGAKAAGKGKRGGSASQKQRRRGMSAGRRGDSKGGTSAEGDLAAAQARLQDLRRLRAAYVAQCKRFVVEPLPVVLRRIDKALQAVEDIDKLVINNCKLSPPDTHALIQTFSGYSPLTALHFWVSELDAQSLEVLTRSGTGSPAALPGLATLHLLDCGVAAGPGAHRIREALVASRTLAALVLDHNPLGTDGVAAVFAGLGSAGAAAALRTCSLRYCDAGPDAAGAVAAALATNTTLTDLDLTGNRIGDEGLVRLAQALCGNATLRVLGLASNNITDREKVLPPLPAAGAGDDSGIAAGDGGIGSAPPAGGAAAPRTSVTYLCEALGTRNRGLGRLDLRGNAIGECGGRGVAEMLRVRRAAASGRRAEPLEVLVSERMPAPLFEEILDLDDAMVEMARKAQKGGGGGKKGGKKGGSGKKKKK